MGQKVLILVGILLVLSGATLGIWYLLSPPQNSTYPQDKTALPQIPSTFTTEGKKLYTLPQLVNTPAPFPVLSQAGVALDLTTGKIFWAKDADTPYFIASLSKIMTGVVALELAKPDRKITISSQATQVGEATMNLQTGEVYTLEELLWGLMLHSANDSAEAIADDLAGRSLVFTQFMNKKAEQLGLKTTHFVNPSGLDEDLAQGGSFLPGKTYRGQTGSTASVSDLVILTKYALDNYPLLARIVASQEKILGATSTHPPKVLYNVMQLSRTYPSLVGVKSGNSDLAGLTVIELAKNRGHEVLVVLLNTPNPRQEVIDLLNYSFSQI